MEVSPEERREIYEEEKARLEAQEKAKKETGAEKTKTRSPYRTCLGVILFTIILAMIAVVLCISSDGKTTTESGPSVGSEARLYSEGSAPFWVAVDEEAFDELISAVVAKDNYGIMELTLAGRVFIVQNNTKVLVIEPGFTKTKVRILEGENAGMAGWVPYEFVQK